MLRIKCLFREQAYIQNCNYQLHIPLHCLAVLFGKLVFLKLFLYNGASNCLNDIAEYCFPLELYSGQIYCFMRFMCNIPSSSSFAQWQRLMLEEKLFVSPKVAPYFLFLRQVSVIKSVLLSIVAFSVLFMRSKMEKWK